LNIDKCRIPTQEDQRRPSKGGDNGLAGSSTFKIRERKVEEQVQHTGRFPANLILSDDPEVEAVFPQTQQATSRTPSNKTGVTNFSGGNNLNIYQDNTNSASRFFYTAKSSKSERNAGLEGFEDVLGGSLEGGNDKRNGDRPQLQPTKNGHPTVKPLSLTKYLATLIKPPTGGRLLVPFSGSGSEMIGALQAGWEYVEGVELTEEYIPIAEARIKYWLEKKEAENPQVALNV